jgi:hypothetical protein
VHSSSIRVRFVPPFQIRAHRCRPGSEALDDAAANGVRKRLGR